MVVPCRNNTTISSRAARCITPPNPSAVLAARLCGRQSILRYADPADGFVGARAVFGGFGIPTRRLVALAVRGLAALRVAQHDLGWGTAGEGEEHERESRNRTHAFPRSRKRDMKTGAVACRAPALVYAKPGTDRV